MIGLDNLITLYLPAVVILYFLHKNRRIGVELLLIYIFSIGLAVLLKDLFKIERVHLIEPEGITLSKYDFPSLSTQLAVTFWGFLFLRYRKLILFVVALLAVSFVSYHKMINHEHDLSDILGGIVVGILLIAVFDLVSKRITKKNG